VAGVEQRNKQTSAHLLCEYEALASPRFTYLGFFPLDPEGVKDSKSGDNLEQGSHEVPSDCRAQRALSKV